MGCFRTCTKEDLHQIEAWLKSEVSVEPDQKILDKLMGGEKVDLTKPGAWGRFTDRVMKEAFLQTHPMAQAQVKVEKGRPQAGKLGYADVVHEHIVIDWKTENLDRPDLASKSSLDAKLNSIADQVESYVRSRDLPQAEVGIVFFQFPPSDSSRQDYAEQYLGERGIGVVWGPRY